MKSKGLLLVLLSGICTGMAPLFSKVAMSEGFSAFTLLYARVLFSVPILYLIVRSRGPLPKLRRDQLKPALLLSGAFTLTLGTLISSYNLIPSGVAMTFHFSYPIFVVILAYLVFRQKPTKVQLLCIFLAIAGVVLMQNASGGLQPFGVALAIFSGVCYATYLLTMKKSSLSELHPFVMNFYLHAVGILLISIFLPVQKGFPVASSLLGWGAALGVAAIVSVLAMTLLQSGMKSTSAQSAAILTTLEPVTSVILGVLVFQEVLTFRTLIGLALVLGSVVILSLARGQKSVE